MLYRLFSGDKFVNAFAIAVLAALLWMPSFLLQNTAALAYPAEPMPLYGFFARTFEGMALLSRMFTFLFLLFQAILIVRLNARHTLIQQRTFLPALFFLMITGFYLPLLNFQEAVFGSFFFIIMLDLLFSSYKQPPNTYRFFEAGLLLGLASLFYARLIWLLPFIWIMAVIIRPFYWREWLYPVLGLALPYLFIMAGTYVAGGEVLKIFSTLKTNLFFFGDPFIPETGFLVVTALIFLLIFIASVYMLRVYQFKKIYIRNYYMAFFWLFVSSLIFFVLNRLDPGIICVFAIPVSFILSNYFINSRKTRGNMILFTLIILVIVANALNGIFAWI